MGMKRKIKSSNKEGTEPTTFIIESGLKLEKVVKDLGVFLQIAVIQMGILVIVIMLYIGWYVFGTAKPREIEVVGLLLIPPILTVYFYLKNRKTLDKVLDIYEKSQEFEEKLRKELKE